ncbi:hypothetical protein [Hugenholtzia roseola]|uniref:hypothetical protein n=1 Tax=Hugenholtzia roseola TaxID=1002 RepID=UPI000403BAC7|nr:hypothetical protein [Hugenholtzia roseola]
MKTKLLTFIFLSWTFLLQAQFAEQFSILALKGQAWQNEQPLRVGGKISPQNKLILAENTYIGLVNQEGQTLELRGAAQWTFEQLKEKVAQKSADDLSLRYAQYVLGKLTGEDKEHQLRYTTETGATERTTEQQDVAVAFPSSVSLLGEQTVFSWFLNESKVKVRPQEIEKYVVQVMDLYNEVLFKEETKSEEIVLNLNDPRCKQNQAFIVQVVAMPAGKKQLLSRPNYIKRLNNEVSRKYASEASRIGESHSALGNLIKAQYFEERGLLADALMAYRRTLSIEPEVESYQILYEQFLKRHHLDKESILGVKK